MIEGIYLLLGSNLGDKELMLQQATEAISQKAGVITNQSSIYETAAWGKEDQPSFYNQVLVISSTLSPEDLLACINKIEAQLGRVRIEKWGTRTIDIDILYYNNQIIDTPNLSIPHPGIPERKFTLCPLNEIAPDYIHPILNKSNQELYIDCTDPLPVNRV